VVARAWSEPGYAGLMMPEKFRERNPDFFFLIEVNKKPTTQKN
jgi:hypothetical protein